ncbi:MAG: MBOAT family protein [Erysipelotrichia bacterium]|nr:MBOAT family protein [Erysipelotrichia bacterium]NCC54588.1 MBOAT family protein [Erysipelotrichia bacterium]
MSFSTLFFVFTWLPCVLLLYFVLPKKCQNYVLLIASLIFYAWGEPVYIFLLLGLILLNYLFAIMLENPHKKGRKLFFIEVIIFNIFILFYFKYYAFTLETIFSLTHTSIAYRIFDMPLGISFFMFTLLSYLVDIYRGRTKAERNVLHFALFVSFFPKLIMGPITTYPMMQEQLKNHSTSYSLFSVGAKKFIIGLAQKVILANTFGVLFVSLQTLPLSMAGSWFMALAYTLQLYFDFCGYSHMAMGLSNMFGYKLPENFNYPYMAKSIKDFWSRWHMTLSHFFRDYVYISLGGNRVSTIRHIVNILVVWLLTGIWHGANYTFIVWGLYYGVLLIFEKYVWYKVQKRVPALFNHLITMFVVMIGWVLFFSEDISSACQILNSMFNFNVLTTSGVTFYFKTYFFYICIGIIGATPLIRSLNILLNHHYNKVFYLLNMIVVFIVFLLSIAFMISSSYQSFLYFAF